MGEVEITIKLSGVQMTHMSINNKIINTYELRSPEVNIFRSVSEITEDTVVISVSITGIIGGMLEIQTKLTETGKSANETLLILKNNRAKGEYNYSLEDFKSIPIALELKYRDNIGYGEDERGLIKPAKLKNYEVDIWYGTNRQPLSEDNANSHFSNELGELTLGKCCVNIPGNRKIGELNRPSWWKLEFKENIDKHFKVLSNKSLDESQFLLDLVKKISESSEQDAFLFIHGFNTSFENGILRTAQLAFDLGFKGAPIFYGWPSFGNVLNYPEDEYSVKLSTTHFINFLKMLNPVISNKKVHIIAHSMGNRLLTTAIKEIKKDESLNTLSFNQIILAAPDVDANEFISDFAEAILNAAKRVTLYASSADTALRISRNIHSSTIRLGESGNLITCYSGLDTIDATNTDPSFIGHGYYSNTAQLIGDIFNLIKFNFNPELRNLVPHHSADELYWSFR